MKMLKMDTVIGGMLGAGIGMAYQNQSRSLMVRNSPLVICVGYVVGALAWQGLLDE